MYLDFGTMSFIMGSQGITVIMITFAFMGNVQTNERILDFNSGSNGIQDMYLVRRGSGSTLWFQFEESTGDQVVAADSFPLTQNTTYQVMVVYDPSLGSSGLLSMYINNILTEERFLRLSEPTRHI